MKTKQFNSPMDVFKKKKQQVKELEEDRINNVCNRCSLKDDFNSEQVCKFCDKDNE
jgi:hypothetical protein